jgi:hypothetical protein
MFGIFISPEGSRFGAAVAGAVAPAGAAAGAAGCGRVTDAVAAGAGVGAAAAAGVGAAATAGVGAAATAGVAALAGAAAWALPSIEVRPWMSCVAAAGLVTSCWRNGRPGTLGAGAGAAAGSAAAVALSPSASPAAPVVAIMQVASIFLVSFMFFQSVVGTPGPRVVELLVLLK